MRALRQDELSGTRVLVVDDDVDNREMLALILEHSGAIVATAQSAADALRIFEKEPLHLLISDIGLPGEDGFSLLRKVRALPKELGGDIPAIALTGYGREEDRAMSLGQGFQEHLTKPVVLEDVLRAVVRVLHSP